MCILKACLQADIAMKTVIIYEILHFLKIYIFENFLILNACYLNYRANITFKQFTKWCFTLWFYNFILKMGERKKVDDTFLMKKTEEKQNSAIIICRWISDNLSNKVKITRESLENILKEKKFLKKLINLIETNHQINMTSDHSVWNNISFKSHLNAKSFNMFWTLQQLYKARWFHFNVCCKGDVNV